MAGEILTIDPTAEGSGAEYVINNNTTRFLISHEYPVPDTEVVNAGTIDTEGVVPAAGKHGPRTITIQVRLAQPAGGTPTITQLASDLQVKIAHLWREGGTLKRTLPTGESIVFDCLRWGASVDIPSDKRWVARGLCTATITLVCRPYGRGDAMSATLSTSTATTKAPLVFTTTGVKGDVPALGSLVIGNVSNAKTCFRWGVESRRYSSASSAALLIEAEGSNLTDGVADPGYSGASGAGANKVMRFTNLGATFKSHYVGGSAGLTHVGAFRVFARLQADTGNTGIVSASLSWAPQKTGGDVLNDSVAVQTEAGAAIARTMGGVWASGGRLIMDPAITGMSGELERELRLRDPGRVVVMRCETVIEFDIGPDGPTAEQVAAVQAAASRAEAT